MITHCLFTQSPQSQSFVFKTPRPARLNQLVKLFNPSPAQHVRKNVFKISCCLCHLSWQLTGSGFGELHNFCTTYGNARQFPFKVQNTELGGGTLPCSSVKRALCVLYSGSLLLAAAIWHFQTDQIKKLFVELIKLTVAT